MSKLDYQVDSVMAGSVPLVHQITFSLDSGRSLALIGESGSGKTMTAMTILGLLPANVHAEGLSIVLNGSEIADLPERKRKRLLGRKLIYIPQSGLDSLHPMQTVRQHFYEGFQAHGIPRSKWKAMAEAGLSATGLDPAEVLDLYPFEISGGMAQKVILGLSVSEDAQLVIADEPTNGLDAASRSTYIAQLHSMFANVMKIIITHDISLASLCDHVLIMCGGTAVEYGTAAEVFSHARHPYTQALINSLPEKGLRPYPVIRDGASGCPFYSRCDHPCNACTSADIPMIESNGHRWRCVHASD